MHIRMWLCVKCSDMLHGCMAYTECTETAAVPRGASQQPNSAVSTLLRMIFQTRYTWKTTVIQSQSHCDKSAVSLLETGKKSYMKAIIIIKYFHWMGLVVVSISKQKKYCRFVSKLNSALLIRSLPPRKAKKGWLVVTYLILCQPWRTCSWRHWHTLLRTKWQLSRLRLRDYQALNWKKKKRV